MPPSENSLTLHATHEILKWLERRTSKAIAKSPSRINEGNRDGGYDVEHITARAFHLQYKSIHNERKTSFTLRDGSNSSYNPYCQYKLKLGQHNTLLIHNEAVNHGFYALPLVQSENGLTDTLSKTVFVNIYAIEIPTKYLYVSETPNNQPVVYGRTYHRFGSGAEFYPITSGVYTWNSLRSQLQRDALGFEIRNQAGFTSTYADRLIRQVLLKHLYDSQWSPQNIASDGGERPSQLRRDIAEYLTSYVFEQIEQFNESHQDLNERKRVSRESFIDMLKDYAETRDPSLHGIRRSRQILTEQGAAIDSNQGTSLEDITREGANIPNSKFVDLL